MPQGAHAADIPPDGAPWDREPLGKLGAGPVAARLELGEEIEEPAAALVYEPAVLFLDEPTTVFLTTQYLEEADQLCERIAIIDSGRIVRQGAPQPLKADRRARRGATRSRRSTTCSSTRRGGPERVRAARAPQRAVGRRLRRLHAAHRAEDPQRGGTNSGGLILFPLLFLTPNFVPRDLLTEPMEIAATLNPVTYLMEALRSLILDDLDWGAILPGFGVVLALGAVMLVLSVRMIQRYD